MQQMLKQRKKDFEFRNGIQEKMSTVNCDEEALQDKMARKDQKILQIDRDRHNLRNQIKEKDEEIRVLKNAQKNNLRDKQANHAQVEQKLTKSEFELKRMKAQVAKLQDQLKRQMDLKSGGTFSGMEVTSIVDLGISSNVEPGSKVGQQRVGMEFKDMLESGVKQQL